MSISTTLCRVGLALAVVLGAPAAVNAASAIIVNDTWQDGSRTDPAAPTYSENSVDADFDGNVESAWYNGGASTMTPSPGHLLTDLTGASANWTTYFTAEGAEVNLADNGDALRITWQFSLGGVAAPNASQNFRIGLVDSIAGNRLAADGSPLAGSAGNPYTGYAIFANMGTTLAHSTPFQLRERVLNSGSNNILGTATDWSPASLTGTTNGAQLGNGGFENGVVYTFIWTLTRKGAGIDIDATLSGGTYNTIGIGTIDANDPNGNGFAFDTFNVRPSSEVGTASVFDTTLFKVELIAGSLLGDFDDDGDVDVTDYLTLVAHLHTDVSSLTPAQSYPLGDMTRDLQLNGRDFLAFAKAYDDANGVAAFAAMLAAVPEPSGSALALASAGLAAMAGSRRKTAFRDLRNVRG